MRVVETARQQVAFARRMQREQARVTFARLPFRGIGEHVHLAREAREGRHHRAASVIFHDELRDENRVGEIWKRVAEALSRVYAAQRVKIRFGVFADEQFISVAWADGIRQRSGLVRAWNAMPGTDSWQRATYVAAASTSPRCRKWFCRGVALLRPAHMLGAMMRIRQIRTPHSAVILSEAKNLSWCKRIANCYAGERSFVPQ